MAKLEGSLSEGFKMFYDNNMELKTYKNKNQFSEEIAKGKTYAKAMHEHKQSAWSGFGMFGMIGWSVVVPALLGAALGIWLDRHYHQSFSWTLTFLLAGTILGCIIAWTGLQRRIKICIRIKRKTMNEIPYILLNFIAGIILGAIFLAAYGSP